MTRPVLLLGHAGVLGGAERSLLDAVPVLTPASAMLFADGPFRAALEARGIPTVVHAMRDIGRVRKETRRPTVAALRDAWRLAGVVAAHAVPDAILYANSQKAFVIAALSVLRRRRPLIWHLRDLLGAPHFSTLNARAVTWLANRCATRVIVNSHAAGDAFVASGGRAALVRVVHNGIDAAPFAAAQASRDATRRALGVDGRWVIATVGRIAPWKGQQVVIDALARLPGDVHALIIGAPLFGEDAFAEALVAQATELGVRDRVHFLGERDDVPALLAASDVVVHSSTLAEPFGRVIVEGMLAERPVIASDAGGVREIITSPAIGIRTAPSDVDALVAACERLRGDAAGAATMARAGSAHARAHFTVDAMRDSIRAVLAEVGR